MAINNDAFKKNAYKSKKSAFFRKGVVIALASGLLYGFYSAFLTQGTSSGIWVDFYSNPLLSAFFVTYVLGAIMSALNDTFAAITMLIKSFIRGTIGDVLRCLKTKPGVIMMCCGLAGGPIATTAYVIGLAIAGPIAAPISALCSAIGAILGRFVFKQKLNFRMICGIIICFVAAVILGGTAFLEEGTSFIGCVIAFFAALGWGFEGCVGGFGTSMLDNTIGVTIRECTSSIVNVLILIPLLSFMAGDLTAGWSYFGKALTDISVIWIIAGGVCCAYSFMFWYKANSRVGAALGMTCNATYSFWVPLCCWLLMGVIMGQDGWALTPVQWAMAIVEVLGIWLIAMNPLDLFRKKEAA
ncbi:MAG: hypothetical protein ACI3W6_03965 [Clostridia bacterium]